jgi:hypothetical protein
MLICITELPVACQLGLSLPVTFGHELLFFQNQMSIIAILFENICWLDTYTTNYTEFKILNIYLCFHHTMTSSHAREIIANNQGKILLHILTCEALLIGSFLYLCAVINITYTALFCYTCLAVRQPRRYLVHILFRVCFIAMV